MKKFITAALIAISFGVISPIGVAQASADNSTEPDYVESIEAVDDNAKNKPELNNGYGYKYVSITVKESNVPTYVIKDGQLVKSNIKAIPGSQWNAINTVTGSQDTTYYQISDAQYLKYVDDDSLSVEYGTMFVAPLYVNTDN